MKYRYRSAITGRYVTKEYAEANPDTTVGEKPTRFAISIEDARGVVIENNTIKDCKAGIYIGEDQ